VNNDKMGTFWQALATIVIWAMVMAGMGIGSVFLVPQMGEEVMGFFFLLFGAAIVCTGFVWKWGQMPGQGKGQGKQKNESYNYGSDYDYEEKRKHDRLSNALKALSDDDLIRLRERIARGEIQEEDLASVLREDER
jgi:hypothetical protein